MKKKFIFILSAVAFVCIGTVITCVLLSKADKKSKSEALKKIIENNLFDNIDAFDGRILARNYISNDEETGISTEKIQLLDIYANELASYTVTLNNTENIGPKIVTNDGGFLFVIGFSDRMLTPGVWASDNGFASHIIKCNKKGKLQFDIELKDIEGSALSKCFEADGKYYFFGTIETPETKERGSWSYSDVYMTVLNEKGEVLKTVVVAGSDFDSLITAEYIDNEFVLYIRSQSTDGDFVGTTLGATPAEWIFTVNKDLEVARKEQKSGGNISNRVIGVKDGKLLYRYDEFLKDYDAGTPKAYIDYGDFYMIVSGRATEPYGKQPATMNLIWYKYEAIYSCFDKNGVLLSRDIVDSTPDYDAALKKIEERMK